jgi:hypothetical protein
VNQPEISPPPPRAAGLVHRHEWNAAGIPIGQRLRLVHINHYYTAYLQASQSETAMLDVPPELPGAFPPVELGV